MPQGKGTYGSKVGRPPKKKMGGGMLKKKPVAMKKGGAVETSLRPKKRPRQLEERIARRKKRDKRAAEIKSGAAIDKKMNRDNFPQSKAMQEKKQTVDDFFNMVTSMSTDNKKDGGKIKKMRDGGMCRGMGAATKGGRYKI